MKTVLCYGDSLTWGYNAETLDRHAHGDRWPSVLAKALGPDVTVIAEGLNGRTTAYDDQIDLVILFLGANDMKPVICGTAFGAVQGMERLVELVRRHAWSFGDAEGPEVLIVSPPPLCETANTAFAAMFAGGVEQSAMLATLYADLADETGCGFFDAGSVAETTPLDGVHLDAKNTRAIGKGLEPIVRMMLGL